MLVRDCMTPKPITVTPQETLQGAMELLAMKHIRHLPVVDAAGKLLGLVTDRDLRRVAPSPLFPVDPAQVEATMEKTSVERVMVRSPTSIGPQQNLKDAVKLLVEKKYGALPVVDGGKLVGIITPIDVMRCWQKANP